jgi:hypothetical protein
MSAKTATPKTTALVQPAKKLTVRKTPAKQAPAAKTTVAEAPKASGQEKKSKKNKTAGGKMKVVRDSFTMPQSDYAKIGEFKQLCLKNGLHAKKSELLRAGLHALGKLNAAQLKAALSGLEKIETGRPKKEPAAKK